MMMMCRVERALLATLLASSLAPRACGQDDRSIEEIRRELEALGDAGLRREVEGWGEIRAVNDLCLVEIIRRGGPTWIEFIEERLEKLRGWETLRGREGELELLTVLRRLQGEPDPVSIRIDGAAAAECAFPDLPEFAVALTNVDRLGTAVSITDGGDYRSGRWERWRFSVRGPDGVEVPIRQRWGVMGGLFKHSVLEPGASWRTRLRMGDYLDCPPPGEYEIEIQYHDRVRLSNFPRTEGLVLCHSERVRLTVIPRVIALAATERDAASDLIARLDGSAPLRILAGTYGEWAHDFIAPDSVPGRILDLGWTAVPALLARLEDKRVTCGERAWILGLLFATTGLLDPRREHGILGPHEYRECGFSTFGGLDPDRSSGGFGAGAGGTVWGGAIDEDRQRAFARRWEAVRGHLRVVDRE